MEVVVVQWAIRFALVAGLGAGALSLAAGAELMDAVIRALIAALAFLLVARFLLDRLEPPEMKLARLRARRAKRAAKAVKDAKNDKAAKAAAAKFPSAGDPASTRAIARSRNA